MADFIKSHMTDILSNWEAFAATLTPAAERLSRTELRDFAKEMLLALAEDMATGQSEAERHQKSLDAIAGHAPKVTETAREHAAERLGEGFTLDQLIAEYRALRASVVRLWRAQLSSGARQESLEELTRFHEALDESMTEAVRWYSQRTNDARDLLQGMLAHDLRNPLHAMLLHTTVLLRDGTLTNEHAERVARVHNAGTRIQKMVNDLLDFTRIRFGNTLPMAREWTNLKLVCSEVLEDLRALYPEVPMNLECSEELRGEWDSSRLAQMLSNLVGNAVQHGFLDAPVTVRGWAEDDDVLLSVHNFGVPIPTLEQQLIFDPLKRASLRGREEDPKSVGLGLGLFIAKEVAKAHGGTLVVESTVGQGTTFTAKLPQRARD